MRQYDAVHLLLRCATIADEFMMKTTFLTACLLITGLLSVHAGQITAVPGPDDQGGMIMPMVTIQATSGLPTDPTAGIIHVSFNPPYTPVLQSLTEWSPGDWFAEDAAWRNDLSPINGSVAGMPGVNAGNGDLFNNQYGFMFMGMGVPMMANIPTGYSLAIRLDSVSSPDLRSFNYGNANNLWDEVFDGVGSQVLWNGTMWHNYFTLPADALPGLYTAIFEIFIADIPFTGTTGYAQYDPAALSALKNTNFTSAFITYEFTVIPEPAHFVLGLAILALAFRYLQRRRRQGMAIF